MSENIAVVGAGICGLGTALALAARGHQVTIYERDIPPPSGDADQAFFEWKRRGAAQFRHPHAFLAVMCNLLQDNYPDLIDQFWEAGARKLSFADMLGPELMDQYEPEPGDDDLWLLLCRRATMETVLRRYVESSHNVAINNSTTVTGIVGEPQGTSINVSGLKVRADREEEQVINHDIVIDASGRTSKFPEWLSDLGANISKEDDDAEIVYYTRHYQLNAGQEEPSRHSKNRSAGDLGYFKYGVFPGDNGHFAIIVCLPNQETELREAIKVSEQFDAICASIPGLEPWVNPTKSTPTTESFGFGDIHAVWRHYVFEGKPVATNYFAVGDAAVRTNPLYGRGCSTGILHAHMLAEVLMADNDPVKRAVRFDRETEATLRPIFDMSLKEDKQGIERAKAILEGHQIESAKGFKGWFRAAFGDALASASREQIHVLRGVMKTFNLMEKPGDFLKDNAIRWTVFKYMFKGRAKNSRARYQKGPNREEMLKVIAEHPAKAA